MSSTCTRGTGCHTFAALDLLLPADGWLLSRSRMLPMVSTAGLMFECGSCHKKLREQRAITSLCSADADAVVAMQDTCVAASQDNMSRAPGRSAAAGSRRRGRPQAPACLRCRQPGRRTPANRRRIAPHQWQKPATVTAHLPTSQSHTTSGCWLSVREALPLASIELTTKTGELQVRAAHLNAGVLRAEPLWEVR